MKITGIYNTTNTNNNKQHNINHCNCSRPNSLKKDTFNFKGDSVMKDTLHQMTKEVISITGDKNFKYPENYINRILKKDFKQGDWSFLTGKYFISTEMEGLKKRFNINNLIPLAVQEDSQMYACLNTQNKKIEIIDAFATDGNVIVDEYKDYDSWISEQI